MDTHDVQSSESLAFLEQFLGTFQNNRSVAGSTLSAYRQDLVQLDNRLGSLGKNLLTAAARDIRSDIQERLGRGVKPRSVARSLTSYRHFYRHMKETGVRPDDPTDGMVYPRRDDPSFPDLLTHSEVLLLLNAPQTTRPTGYRDRTMLEVLLATGISAAECITLTLQQVDLEGGILHVGKGAHERTLYLGERATLWLHEFIETQRDEILLEKESDVVFPTLRGNAMVRQELWHIIKRYAKKADIKKKISVRLFRYLFTIYFLVRNGRRAYVHLNRIQKILGHAGTSSTRTLLKKIEGVHLSEYTPLILEPLNNGVMLRRSPGFEDLKRFLR